MRVSRTALRGLSRGIQWSLLVAGVAGLCWCAFVVADARYFQADQRREFDWMLSTGLGSKPRSTNIVAAGYGSFMAQARIWYSPNRNRKVAR